MAIMIKYEALLTLYLQVGHDHRLLVQIRLFRHEQEIFMKPYFDIQ